MLSAQLSIYLAYFIWYILILQKRLLRFIQSLNTNRNPYESMHGIAKGKTVLVTTGRQAKTLHTVRALKNIGANVIVTDYEQISTSAISLACDKFILLPSLIPEKLNDWVQNFERILVENQVDVVLPVSTINEVLFLGVCKQRLEQKHPHIHWICPDLNTAILMDDRTQFAALCDKHEVPSPEHGRLISPDNIKRLAKEIPHGIIVKRIESSVNRREEIVRIKPGEEVPLCVQPSPQDPWQWQRFISGSEFSVWYICIDGCVTFNACYKSQPDLVHFDPATVPVSLDTSLRKMIKRMKLTGQYAFDFFVEDGSNHPFVIECNPRSSSILETASETPLWAEAFFGIDVTHRATSNSVGFLFHKNCWPFAARNEGYLDWYDPLPFFCAELAWPLMSVGKAQLSGKTVQKVDTNIGKVICDGPSPARSMKHFEMEIEKTSMKYILSSLNHMDTVLLDADFPGAKSVRNFALDSGKKLVTFSVSSGPKDKDVPNEIIQCKDITEVDKLVRQQTSGETRLLLGEDLSSQSGSPTRVSYKFVTRERTCSSSVCLPLRQIRVLHVMGSCTSRYYERISSYYGYECIANIGCDQRFDHIVAYVHQTGEWSIGTNQTLEYMSKHASRLSPGAALGEIESLNIDVAMPHMFDYDGLTAYRSLLTVLGIPMVGCSGEALALSTNKAMTKACAAIAGVPVPKSEVIRAGQRPSLARPFIVKPTEEDNSQGISVVYKEEDMTRALEEAWKFGDEALCEEFIKAGRELRVAVIENADGELELLPMVEYFVSEKNPIRKPADKLTTNEKGMPNGLASNDRVCPADVDEILRHKLFDAAKKAHRALKCRDYSLYDFRVSPDGEPFMLESCLYCSFAAGSVLVKMQQAAGVDARQLFERLCERAIAREKIGSRQGDQEMGMKRNR